MNEARILFKTKRTPWDVGADVHCDFHDTLDLYVVIGVEQNAIEAWKHVMDEYQIKKLRFTLLYPKTAHLRKDEHLTTFFPAALILHDCHSPFCASNKELLHPAVKCERRSS